MKNAASYITLTALAAFSAAIAQASTGNIAPPITPGSPTLNTSIVAPVAAAPVATTINTSLITSATVNPAVTAIIGNTAPKPLLLRAGPDCDPKPAVEIPASVKKKVDDLMPDYEKKGKAMELAKLVKALAVKLKDCIHIDAAERKKDLADATKAEATAIKEFNAVAGKLNAISEQAGGFINQAADKSPCFTKEELEKKLREYIKTVRAEKDAKAKTDADTAFAAMTKKECTP